MRIATNSLLGLNRFTVDAFIKYGYNKITV